MIEKKTVIDQIEVTRAGHIQIRIGKLIVEDGRELSCQWHRTAVEVGGDVDAQIEAVNAHLIEMGEAPIDAAGIAKVKTMAVAAWTPEVLEAQTQEVFTKIATLQAARLTLKELEAAPGALATAE